MLKLLGIVSASILAAVLVYQLLMISFNPPRPEPMIRYTLPRDVEWVGFIPGFVGWLRDQR